MYTYMYMLIVSCLKCAFFFTVPWMLLDLLTDNATVADLVGLTFWKYIEATKDPVELVCVGTL